MRRSISDEIRRMQEKMDMMFRNIFSSKFYELENYGEYESYRKPLASTKETEKEIVMEIELPGVDKKDLQVSVAEEGIEVKAESKSEISQEDKKKGSYRFESMYSGFYRKLPLPKNVDPGRANAEYKDGILKITIPKLRIKERKKKLLEVK